MKINSFWGDPSDISAKKQPPVQRSEPFIKIKLIVCFIYFGPVSILFDNENIQVPGSSTRYFGLNTLHGDSGAAARAAWGNVGVDQSSVFQN